MKSELLFMEHLYLNQAPFHEDVLGSAGTTPCILNLSTTRGPDHFTRGERDPGIH